MSLRILHMAPLWHPIKRDSHGGIETLLFELIGNLDRLGFKNSLIASGDSETSASLIPAVEKSLVQQMREGTAFEYCWSEQEQLCLALEHQNDFDIIHSHLTPGAYWLSSISDLKNRVLHTLHSTIHNEIKGFFQRRPDAWLSTVSSYQLQELGGPAQRRRLVQNGLSVNRFTYNPDPTDGLFFMGRIEPQKGPDLAVSVARSLNAQLDLAGPVLDRALFASSIEPYLDGNIRYLGSLNHDQKNERLGSARCVLMPSRWKEPFGLVAIEAMACGTPVVALANGALPEIVEQGVTGYVSDDPKDLPRLVEAASCLDRSAIRQRAIERFDIAETAAGYARLYDDIRRAA
jgi:glycosyltransferase involved in cell wall biosynthesis